MNQLDDTMNRALADAERESLAAAAKAFADGEIKQREVGPGIYVLVRK